MHFIKVSHARKFQLSFHKYGWNRLWDKCILYSDHFSMTKIADLSMVFLSKIFLLAKQREKFHLSTCACSFPKENRAIWVLHKTWFWQNEYFGCLSERTPNLCSKFGNLASRGSLPLEDDYSNFMEPTQVTPEYKALFYMALLEKERLRLRVK